MISFKNIEISETTISEYINDNKVNVIPKETINSIFLSYGFSEERFIASLVTGAGICALGTITGLIPIIQIAIDLFNGKQVHGNLGLYALSTPLLLIGGWLIFIAFRYGFFLEIVTDSSKRKIPLGKKAETEKIEAFIMQCNDLMKYNILAKNERAGLDLEK